MADEKRLGGYEHGLNRFWLILCRIWCFFAVIILILVIVGEVIVMNNSINRYHDIYGSKYASRGYDRDPSGSLSGHVALTNVPKHVGSLVWSSAFQAAIILFCILVAIGDSALIFRSPDNYGHKSMVTLKGTHLTHPTRYNNDDSYKSKGIIREPFFIVGLALLKLFIVAAYMSQSFYGISRGDNNNSGNNNTGSLYSYRSIAERGCDGPNCNDGYGYYGNQPANGGYYGDYNYNNDGGDNNGTDVQLFCLWAGFILLGSLPFTLFAQAFAYMGQVNDSRW